MKALHLLGGIVVAAAHSACGVVKLKTTELHVQDGPLAESHPELVITLASKRSNNNDGSIKYVLPDGAACSGAWALTKGRAPTKTSVNTAMYARGSGWVAKDGSISETGDGGTRVDHGNRLGFAVGTGDCNDGTTFRFSFMADGLHAKGALRDSRGNLFRLVRN
jgi:hypothetical protein